LASAPPPFAAASASRGRTPPHPFAQHLTTSAPSIGKDGHRGLTQHYDDYYDDNDTEDESVEASDLSSDEEEEPVRNSQMNRMLNGAGDAGVRRGRGLGQLANKFSALRTESEERPKLTEKTKKKKKPGTH
jgi:hypothetical protein